MEVTVHLKRPHNRQRAFIDSTTKRKVVRAGRRGGKTTGAAILAMREFLKGRRVLYATPTQEQVDRFWHEVKLALDEAIEAGAFYKNETRHIVELPGTEQRIRAKTAWDADTLRGDYADLLILDEYQMMSEDVWALVGAPMLLDNDGDAVFIYTTKRGKHHSKALFKKAQEDATGRWQTFVFSSMDNPHLSREALDEITGDMTGLAYRAEILAEEVDDDPRALWNRGIIEHVTRCPSLARIVVGVDPPGTEDGAECGIVVAGFAMQGDDRHAYVLEDRSLQGSPARWGGEVVAAYSRNQSDRVIGETNFGGDMVENTIRSVENGRDVAYKSVHASRGKAVRAEPIVAYYEQGRVHHVGEFQGLEDEMCNWVPGESKWSPNRIDALVWALTEMMTGMPAKAKVVTIDYEQ
jgi:phage terminase large subunit-like protein